MKPFSLRIYYDIEESWVAYMAMLGFCVWLLYNYDEVFWGTRHKSLLNENSLSSNFSS